MARKLARTNRYPASSVAREPRACTSRADGAATSTMNTAAGKIAKPASKVE
jgi:hypothetical protein